MAAFFFIILFILIVLYIIFNPVFDCVPLYHGELWYIVWYNKYTIRHWRITKTREWAQLFYIDK